jgi:hypothetical protein
MASSGPVPGWPSTEAAKALRFQVQILKAVAFVVVVLVEGAIILGGWIKAATLPAIHVNCEPRVIGGVQYVCKQAVIDVPAQFDTERFVGLVPAVIVMTILVVGVTFLVIAAIRRAWRGRRGVVRRNAAA